MRVIRAVLIAGMVLTWGGIASAQIPVLNSNTVAAYTVYLDYGGFNFTGSWGNGSSFMPGSTPAYTIDSNPAFSAAEVANMREIWSRTAEKYAIFNVNITTVDPAVAAGQSGSDSQRQNYYDSQTKMMHTVIGGNGGWAGGGGISYIGVTQNTQSSFGYHTNFVFSDVFTVNGVRGTYLKAIGEATAHENGHGLKLNHQSLWSGGVKQQEYDPGDANRAPIMGDSYSSARGLWRIGTNASGSTQNDIALLMTNTGMTYVDSGKGHTLATATPLPVNGTTIDFDQAKGVITPISTTNPNPLGESNYTTDYYKIVVGPGGASVSVTLRSGRSTLNPGIADPGATLDATLRLLDSNGNQLQISNSDTFLESITANNLLEGTYYFQITSAGADAAYFDVGSYFLTGNFVPVPEPTTVLAVAAAGLGLGGAIRRRRLKVA